MRTRLLLAAVLAAAGCSITADYGSPTEDRPCGANRECLPGYACVLDVCVPLPGDGGGVLADAARPATDGGTTPPDAEVIEPADAAGPSDAGSAAPDAASPGTDAASTGQDAGPRDAASPGPDAAAPGRDAAAPAPDAAAPGPDAAAPGPDAAAPGPDAGPTGPTCQAVGGGPLPANTVCRAAAGDCDVDEVCDGTSTTCPSDSKKTAAFTCRPAVGTCDAAETCNGTAANCPADVKVSGGTECRAATGGPCDQAEVCDGLSGQCPSDVAAPNGTICRAAAGLCDVAETCNGTAMTCPSNSLALKDAICRSATDVCDIAEVCDGVTAACPTDAVQPNTTQCRAPGPTCGLAQMCNGTTKACPAVATSTPPPVPTGLADSILAGNPIIAQLSWGAVVDPNGDSVSYQAELSKASDMSNPVQVSTWQTGTTWVAGSLTASTRYYWHVRSRDATHQPCDSAWSTTKDFMTPLAAPVCTAQANVVYSCGTVNPTWNGNLTWAAVSHFNPVSYKFQLSTVSNFASLLIDGTWQAGTSHAVALGYSMYYWRVQARDDTTLALSAWSTTQAFAVTDDCPPPVSCPYVFSWDGQSYLYETDIAGSPLVPGGATVRYFIPRYVPLGKLVADSSGTLHVKLREALAELDYLDQVEIVAVDHPPEAEVFTTTTQNVAEFGRVIPFAWYTATHAVPPIAASNSLGQDILDSVLLADDWTAPMERSPTYSYVFEFGPIAFPENAKLLIDGWTFPYAKPGFPLTEPKIQVVDNSGAWVDATTFGWPSGDFKSFVVPLPHAFPTADHRLRLIPGGNAAIAWVIDRVRLDDSAPTGISSGTAGPLAADLHFRGAVPYTPATPFHRIRAWDTVGTLNSNYFGFGAFTRYGDVLPLLSATDDLYVAMRYGDEVTLSFTDFGPPLPGTVRSYFLKTDYWYKGFKGGRTLEPLPFHGMTTYPYAAPEAYPTDAAHQDYLRTWNTRVEAP